MVALINVGNSIVDNAFSGAIIDNIYCAHIVEVANSILSRIVITFAIAPAISVLGSTVQLVSRANL